MKNYYEAPQSEKLLLSLETSFLASEGKGGRGTEDLKNNKMDGYLSTKGLDYED